ncbi:condensin complex subunit 2-like [Mytilus californianus]|uniref:condensin complex subunit 2-like n=1 Tax=Mytilus californianus TaxID=6549 RepID=UPI0022477E9B|nr:condensin complex subunit 2-like [Mytilus californianus]XP_052101084.1 condensin complex subunit 2-like [Mytilus californianus]
MPSRSDVLSPLTTPAIQKRSGISNTVGSFVSPSTSRHKGMDSPVTMYMEEYDAGTEKRDRRRSRALELKQTVGSPASPAERPSSVSSSHGLTANQLSEHYTNCIKLSAENKINSKNAFGLHLIDYMSDLVKKKELENFQVASTTLDASAKIYAGRVDAIHAETYKVLSGLGSSKDKSKQDDGEEGADEEMADNEDTPENEQIKKKKKKKHTTVETNLKNITAAKVDLAFEVDPMFQLMSEAFDEGGTMGLLHNTLRCFNDDQELVLDSSTVVNADDEIQPSQNKPIDLSDIKEMFRGINLESKEVCPSFSSFTFMDWDENAEDTTVHSQDNGDHAFDMNAEHEPIPEADNDNDDMPDMAGDFPDNDYAESDTSVHDENQNNGITIGDGKAAEMAETIESIKHGTTGTLLSVLASEPSDYSYFNNTLMRAWAGPSHWKIKPLSKDKRLNNQTEQGKKKLKKEPFKMDYEQQIDFDSYFKSSRATMLTKATMIKHSKKKNTLPKDLHYDADKLFRLFQKAKVMIKRQNNTNDNVDVDGEIDNYNFDNSNDMENYCPRGDEPCDDDDDENGEFGFNFTADVCSQETNDSQQGVVVNDTILDGTMLTGDKLLDVPRKVAKIDIGYAKTAKKLDVKRLKKTIWNILTEAEEEKDKPGTSAMQTDQLNKTMDKTISFTSLLAELPKRVSGQTAENLSVPIAFVCLLHLANEKNLKIEDSDMKDLIISQDV